jgi:transcriptional regulator with XRE-family HTH domain
MTAIAHNDINAAARAVGDAIRAMREKSRMSLDDLSRAVSAVSADVVKIGSKTIELVEQGVTDAQLDHMLTLLAAAGIDMRLPGSAIVPREALLETRLAEIRSALFEARHPEGMRKISFKALSDACGIEQGQIGKIESGEAMPRFRTLFALTRALGIEVRFVRMEGRARTSASASRLRRGRARAERKAA